MRYFHETEEILKSGAVSVSKEMKEARSLIEQTEATLDQHGFLDFLDKKLLEHNENLIRERQRQLLQDKLQELLNEKAVCEMMLTSISEIPNHK